MSPPASFSPHLSYILGLISSSQLTIRSSKLYSGVASYFLYPPISLSSMHTRCVHALHERPFMPPSPRKKLHVNKHTPCAGRSYHRDNLLLHPADSHMPRLILRLTCLLVILPKTGKHTHTHTHTRTHTHTQRWLAAAAEQSCL